MHSEAEKSGTAATPSSAARIVMLLLATGALVGATYLVIVSAAKGLTPAGCGEGSGCAEVLSGKYSRWAGVPVSALAEAVYLAVIAALILTGSTRWRQLAWWALVAAATVVTASAAWFIYLQLGRLKAICPYCMADHAFGLALAVMVFWQAAKHWHSDAFGMGRPRMRGFGAVTVGLAGVAVLIMSQLFAALPVSRLTHLPTDRDFDIGTGAQRLIGLIGGRVHLSPVAEPLLGSVDAPHIMAVMVDYSCPHCRDLHHMLLDLKGKPVGDEFAILVLPLPLNRKCNPLIANKLSPRFDHSCERAQTALGVFLADPAKFAAFDRWMFEPKEARPIAEARAEAGRLVGADAIKQALANPRIHQMIARNVSMMRDSGSKRLPIVMVPKFKPLVGQIGDAKQILALFDRVEE